MNQRALAVSSLVPLDQSQRTAVEALMAEPALSAQFEVLGRPGGVEDELGDSRLDLAASRVAYAGERPAGFTFTFLLPTGSAWWSMIWLGVGQEFRRRGIGTMLLEQARSRLLDPAFERRVREICLSAWQPNPEASQFASRHEFHHVRSFWLMDRTGGAVADAAWPAGIDARAFEPGDRAIEELNDIYNSSFAEHWHFVPSEPSDTRELSRSSIFEPEGVFLAYRDGQCVGFCRCARFPERGEIAMLGTAPEARGIGLGRALLRTGIRWLERQGMSRITLIVDGENESALRLYRQEGFEVTRTKHVWSQSVPGLTR